MPASVVDLEAMSKRRPLRDCLGHQSPLHSKETKLRIRERERERMTCPRSHSHTDVALGPAPRTLVPFA